MPEYHIRQQFGKAPDEVFSKVGFSGNHSKTVALVQSGAYQVGATNFKVWKRELAEGKIDPSKISVIWKTPGYPDYQWTIRGDVDQRWGAGFKEKVRQALLEWQRHYRQAPGLVADGRDMGTVVFPHADVKFYLDAAPEVRAYPRARREPSVARPGSRRPPS